MSLFQQLSQNITTSLKHLTHRDRLTESNIQVTLEEIRRAFIDADVALEAIDKFLDRVKQYCLKEHVAIVEGVDARQTLIKVIHEELTRLLGDTTQSLKLNARPPAVIMMVGLQGSGKTTSTIKLALHIRKQYKKSVMVVSTDVYRPAAIDQLNTLAEQNTVHFYPSDPDKKPTRLLKKALAAAKKEFVDVLIVDTAGRLHVDTMMMDESRKLHHLAQPIETLFVVDSMTGQDAANTAKAFHDALPLTGIILTKVDGDARGGAALSMRTITQCPIKFIGVGEQVDAFDIFHPDRAASRILDMGDILSFVEQMQEKVDQNKAQKLAQKVKQGKVFTLEDFSEQLRNIKNLGGMQTILEKLPGMGQVSSMYAQQLDDKRFTQMEIIIQSMTLQEKRFPDCINASRKRRIARGSGTSQQAVSQLLAQFKKMQKMMRKFKGNKMMKMLQRLQ